MEISVRPLSLAEHRTLIAAVREHVTLSAAIDVASNRIAGGFSTEAAARDEIRVRLIRLRTWGE